MSQLLDALRHRDTQRRVWALAGPMVLSNLSVPLVALVDTAVVGHLPQAAQLGAAAVGGSLYTLLVWTFGFLRMGTTGFAAQACGRGDGSALRTLLAQGLLLAAALALLAVLIVLPLLPVLLQLMQPEAQLDQLTRDYFHTRLFGLPAALASYALIGWLLGSQNARGPLAMLLTANLLNVLLDLWFVLGLDWGVAGAARASVLAEWSGALLGLWLARQRLAAFAGQVERAALQRWAAWRPLLAVNRDILLRTLALQSVFLLITLQGTRLGTEVVAANALLLNGMLLTAHALDGLAHAVEALCGHAIGAGDRLALRRSLWVAGCWSWLASLGFSALFWFGGGLFIALQTDIAAVRVVALEYLPYLALLPQVAVWSYLLDGLFVGATRAGDMRNAMLQALLLALPIALLLQPLGNHGLWIAFLAFTALRSLTLGWRWWQIERAGGWGGR